MKMNRYNDAIHIVGKEFVDGWYLGSGTYASYEMILPSGSSLAHPADLYMRETKKSEDLWKCYCGRVHRFPEVLECEGCGSPITEKSRFVLE
jgi:hypothetical protein